MLLDVFDRCSGFNDNSDAYQKFEVEATELLNRAGTGCFARYMFNYLKNNNGGVKISLCMDESVTSGQYDAADKSMKFGSLLYVEKSTILHETIHAVQDKIYPGGIGQYNVMGKPDIEFETALFIDLMKRVEFEPPSALYDDPQLTYRNFLDGLIKDNQGNKTSTGQKCISLMQGFRTTLRT